MFALQNFFIEKLLFYWEIRISWLLFLWILTFWFTVDSSLSLFFLLQAPQKSRQTVLVMGMLRQVGIMFEPSESTHVGRCWPTYESLIDPHCDFIPCVFFLRWTFDVIEAHSPYTHFTEALLGRLLSSYLPGLFSCHQQASAGDNRKWEKKMHLCTV